jgi:hypothetical protein
MAKLPEMIVQLRKNESRDEGYHTDSDHDMPKAGPVVGIPYKEENPANDWHTACNWLGHRTTGYNAVIASRDHQAAMWLVKDDMPQEVDYLGIVLSKRGFERAMQRWRLQLRHLSRRAEEQVACQSMNWLGGPEWLMTAPAGGEVPWPQNLIMKPRTRIVLRNQRHPRSPSKKNRKHGHY